MTVTAEAPRRAGKRGRKAARHLPELRLGFFLTAPYPPTPPPPSGDVTSNIDTWGMDGNDRWSDCVAAASDHYQVAKARSQAVVGQLGGIGPVQLYFECGRAMGEQGTPPDQGLVIATWLLWLYHQGVIEGFAQLDHNNEAQVHQAMLDFGGVLLGIDLTPTAEPDFEASPPRPWTGQNGTPTKGHGVLLAEYDPTGGKVVTWGRLQPYTGLAVREAWVFVSSEDADRVGVNMARLVATIDGLGGQASVASALHSTYTADELRSAYSLAVGTFRAERGGIAFHVPEPNGASMGTPANLDWAALSAQVDQLSAEVTRLEKAVAKDTTPAVALPSWTTTAAWTSYLVTVAGFVLGVLTQLHVSVPHSVSTNVSTWAGLAAYAIGVGAQIFNWARHSTVTKAALTAGVPVKGENLAVTYALRVTRRSA